MTISPDGKTLLLVNGGLIQVYDSETGALMRSAVVPGASVDWLFYSPDGSALVAGTVFGGEGISVLDPILLNQVHRFGALLLGLPSFLNGGTHLLMRMVLSGTTTDTAGVIDLPTGKLVQTFESGPLSTDSDYLVRVFQESRVAFFQNNGEIPWVANWPDFSQRVELEITCPGPFRTAEFNGDGSLLLAAAATCPAEIWDTTTGKLLRSFGEGYPFTYSASFLDNGSKILTAHSDGHLRLWDHKTGGLVGTAKVNDYGVHNLSFSQDRSRLATISRGHDVSIWKLHLAD